MRRTFILILLFAAAAAPAKAADFEGPLQVRNQFPLVLGMAPPFFDQAAVGDSFSAVLLHSSVYLVQTKDEWAVNLDLELTELDLRFRKLAGPRTELGLDLPVIRPTGGFFDRPLEAWHDIVGMGDYGRSERPFNSFLYRIDHNGQPVIQGVNDRTGLGDLRVTVKQQVRDASPVISIQADAEAPTGDAKAGYGNGSWDVGAAVLMDLAVADRYRCYVNAGVVVPGDLKAYQTIPLRTFAYGAFGIEAAWWERLHALVQVLAATDPFPETGIREADWPSALLTFGGRYSFGRSSLELSLTEDPTTAGTPDFTVAAAWRMRF